MESDYQSRRLPHWNPGDAALFITWRLYGSLPAPEPEWEALPKAQRFAAEDRALDKLSFGPHHLKNPAIAEVVRKSLYYGADPLRLYDLHAWVIMSNHVHILIGPLAPLERITRAIKNYSAREANSILNRTGLPFWQKESYDRWIRDGSEFNEIVRYIEDNPVVAGLISKPEDWRYSSAWGGREAAPTNACSGREAHLI